MSSAIDYELALQTGPSRNTDQAAWMTCFPHTESDLVGVKAKVLRPALTPTSGEFPGNKRDAGPQTETTNPIRALPEGRTGRWLLVGFFGPAEGA